MYKISLIRANDIYLFISLTAIGGLIGYVYTKFVYLSNPANAEGSVWLGVAIGASIMFFSAAFELLLVSHPYSPFKKVPFLISLGARILMHVLIVTFASAACHLIYGAIYDIVPFFLRPEAGADVVSDTLFSVLFIGIIVFFLQIRMLIGGGQLRNMLLGKYHQPRKENRIFMFIDVAESSAIAAEIGDIQFHQYLNDIFVLVDKPIRDGGGGIHSYVGDAVIAVWPFEKDKQRNGRILETALQIEMLLQDREKWFEEKYKITPRIRIALHAGAVVVGETGNSKRQITYLGSTVNLVARIEQKTKELGFSILASEHLIQNCDVPKSVAVTVLGEYALKGFEGKIALFCLNEQRQSEG